MLTTFDEFSNLTLNGKMQDNPFASVPYHLGVGVGIGTTALGALMLVQTGQPVPLVIVDPRRGRNGT